MKLPFIKMHAQGNDFIIIDDDIPIAVEQIKQLVTDICDRHFGVGADGLVLLDRTKPQMTIFNADGSRAEMCGSALRCCGALLYSETGHIKNNLLTDSGYLETITDNVNPDYVTVEISTPILLQSEVELAGFKGDYINAGNPHYVVFLSDLSDDPHLKFGQQLSESPFFPEGANIEFVKIISPAELQMFVWERGAGATLACGTGATAAVFSGQLHNILRDKVKVYLPGGNINIMCKDNRYFLAGDTALVARGEYLWKI